MTKKHEKAILSASAKLWPPAALLSSTSLISADKTNILIGMVGHYWWVNILLFHSNQSHSSHPGSLLEQLMHLKQLKATECN